jgi:hypothetical protein
MPCGLKNWIYSIVWKTLFLVSATCTLSHMALELYLLTRLLFIYDV